MFQKINTKEESLWFIRGVNYFGFFISIPLSDGVQVSLPMPFAEEGL